MDNQSSHQDLDTFQPDTEIPNDYGRRSIWKRLKRKYIKLSHFFIKGVLYLMWAAVAYQAIVYFINPVRVDVYKLAVEYWKGMWEVLV
jgi:hypothetical protein